MSPPLPGDAISISPPTDRRQGKATLSRDFSGAELVDGFLNGKHGNGDYRIGNFHSRRNNHNGNTVSGATIPQWRMDLKRLKSQLDRPGYSQAELARRLGLAPSGVSKILKGTRKIIAHEAEIIRQYVDASPSEPVTSTSQDATTQLQAGTVEPTDFQPAPNAQVAPNAPPIPYRSEMPRDVPVYGTVSGGKGDDLFDFELNGEIVDYVRRPPRLVGRTDIFAAYITGVSISPWREQGQLVYFEKARPARPMDYVLVEMKPHDGESVRPALIKRLIAITPTRVRLRQYTPFKEFELDRDRVLQVIRAIDWDEMMGV